MKQLVVSDADKMIMALQDEIRRSEVSRYDHRLHGLLLVAQALSCLEVAGVLGDALRKQFKIGCGALNRMVLVA